VTTHAENPSATGWSSEVRDEDELLAALLASARAIAGAERMENLESALVRRDIIGQAKGLLMHRYDVDADEAFARLRHASQTTNTKLYDVAAWLVTCRTL
jgi:AmiR/NasT family two-component response regulator